MDPVQPVAGAIAALAPQGAAAATPGGADFLDALGQALARADAAQGRAETLAQSYQLGDPAVTLEGAMVAMQEANVSLQFAVQVRNRIVGAYQDIMNMPV